MKDELLYKELGAYKKSYQAALDIFQLTKRFPKDEIYSLSDQIRRSSRSVCVNIVEGYRRRIYPKSFISRLVDADAECSETIVWLEFAKDFSYITQRDCEEMTLQYIEIGRLLGYMIKNPTKFQSKK